MTDARSVKYRVAYDTDAIAIADVQARSWRTTYRGSFPDAYLDHEVHGELAAAWQDGFKDRAGTLTIVASAGDEVSGFAHAIIDDNDDWGTLLGNLHVAPGMKRRGIGRQLVAETATRLLSQEATTRMHLWVLEGNHGARRFYDSLGGEVTASIVDDVHHGIKLPVLRYSWSDVTPLANVSEPPSASAGQH